MVKDPRVVMSLAKSRQLRGRVRKINDLLPCAIQLLGWFVVLASRLLPVTPIFVWIIFSLLVPTVLLPVPSPLHFGLTPSTPPPPVSCCNGKCGRFYQRDRWMV